MSDVLALQEEPKVNDESKWYVVHTYSGYENKVKANIEKIIENRGMHELIDQVVVPVQDALEMKNGRKKIVQRKILPGYEFLKQRQQGGQVIIVRQGEGDTQKGGFRGRGFRVPAPDSGEDGGAHPAKGAYGVCLKRFLGQRVQPGGQ